MAVAQSVSTLQKEPGENTQIRLGCHIQFSTVHVCIQLQKDNVNDSDVFGLLRETREMRQVDQEDAKL